MIVWELRPVAFKYQLSDWVIGSATMPLQCRSADIFAEAPLAEVPPVPFGELQQGSQGFMIRALPVSAPLPRLRRKDAFLVYVPLQYRHCYIDLSSGFEAYKQKFSSKTRATISRKIKKYAEHGGGNIVWRTYRQPEEIREFFRLARTVSQLTYQERLLDAGLPGAEEFIRTAEALAAENRLRAYLLFDGDRPVSYLYCPVNNQVLIYAYLGYDPEYLKLSVGTVLQWLALEELFAEGCFKAFDFTEGQSEHKRLFATHMQHCANVYLVKDRIGNRLIVYSHNWVDNLSGRLGETLHRLGLKAKIKRLLRFG